MQRVKAKELLQKYNKGQCTEEEIALIESWYLDFRQKPPVELSEEERIADIEDICARLRSLSMPRSSLIPFWKRTAAAAAILIIAGLGLWLYHSFLKTPQYVVFTEDIGPGSNKAILTLADGARISLTETKSGKVAKQPGVVISKTSDGRLIYKVNDMSSSERAAATATLYNTIETPRGGQFQVILPDGTAVWLNAASKLTFPVNFSDVERQVEMTGEAYFEVATKEKNKRSSRSGSTHREKIPFLVKSGGQKVEVLATRFNINAYADEPAIKTTLLEGAVRVTNDDARRQLAAGSVLLKPGEQSLFSGSLRVVSADTEEAISWKSGFFKFNDEKIESIMRKLSRWYDISVTYEGDVPNEEYNGKVPRYENISQVLKILAKTKTVRFKAEGRRITVMK